jgi:dipeptidyl aminopeptidase/acylaminoacyl peptidase
MSLDSIKLFSGVFLSLSLLSIGGPFVGELIATLAPVYSESATQLVDELGISYEVVNFPTTDDLSLRGWFFPTDNPDSPAILYAPATGNDLRSGLSLVSPLHEAGYQVLLFSYRGHGLSDGNPMGFTYGALESEDVDAAVRYLNESRGIQRIGAIGHSAGAVSIILSAARSPQIGAVVAASAFNSIEEIWQTNRPTLIPKPVLDLSMWMSEIRKGYSRNDVRPEDIIAQISPRPVLLIHGSDDKRITNDQAMRMFTSAQQPKRLWIIEGAGHAEVRSPSLDFLIHNIIEFLNNALLP